VICRFVPLELVKLQIIKPNAVTEPGLVACYEWWPDGPTIKDPSLAARCIAGLVARKP